MFESSLVEPKSYLKYKQRVGYLKCIIFRNVTNLTCSLLLNKSNCQMPETIKVKAKAKSENVSQTVDTSLNWLKHKTYVYKP